MVDVVLARTKIQKKKVKGYNIWNTKTQRYIFKNFLSAEDFRTVYVEVLTKEYQRKILKVLETSMHRADKYGCEIPAPEGRCKCL